MAQIKTLIGIISWLPDEPETRWVRLKRLKSLLYMCEYNMNLPIIIIAQNWKDVDIGKKDKTTIFYYDKLGITAAREELRKKFLETDYTHMLCLDDDFELNPLPVQFQMYFKRIAQVPDHFIEYENYLMNLCVMPRNIAEKYPFDTSISAELNTGFEDWVWVEVIKKKEPNKYSKISGLSLAAKSRRDLVEDKYSTWITKDVNKDELTKKSLQLIHKLTS